MRWAIGILLGLQIGTCSEGATSSVRLAVGAEGLLLFSAVAAVWVLRWRDRVMRERNNQLEAEIRRQTSELEVACAKVMEEKYRADLASAAKAQFLANMSHEIRTPLNGLLGLAAVLQDAQDISESRETIRLIQSSGQTLMRVINDVLDYSKIEAGKLQLETSPFRLAAALEECAALFRTTAEGKGLRLRVLIDSIVPVWVAGDEIRLRQVVMNLAANAVKFTQSGEVVVAARVVSQDDRSHIVEVEVRDTGIGIAPSHLSTLFESFTQADSSISRRYGGTGLGLAISKRLVELMGGRIDVESKVNVGTSFRVTLRFIRAAAPAPAPSNGSMASAMATCGLRVLLAEDNKINQRVGQKLLEKLGVSVDVVEDGAQAIAAALRKDYDLILMDVQMPDVDGIAATKAIREQIASHKQPFICALSAHATSDYQDRCMEAGMDRYLTKPLEFGKLKSLIAERWAATGGKPVSVLSPIP